MGRFKSVTEALDFAISEEQGAAVFYTMLAREARSADMRLVFELFAREECAHKTKLEGVKEGKSLLEASDRVTELLVTDYRVDRESTRADTYQGALLLAMQKEKAAYRMYNDLAQATNVQTLQHLFRGLAQEEANHQLRFELEYDACITPEN